MPDGKWFSISGFEQKIQKMWYEQESCWLYLFYPLSFLYFLLSRFRFFLYQKGIFQTHSVPVPVIVVGNITVGGTGKTPVVIALVEYLKQQGLKPGVVSRGYSGHADAYPMLVNGQSEIAECGDEPYLIFKRTGVPVVVDPKRIRAASLLAYDADCDVIISDDGLQHYALHRDLELLLVDAARGFGNKKLLPVGPLREPLTRLKAVDWVLLNCGLVKKEQECEVEQHVLESLQDFNERISEVFLKIEGIQPLSYTHFDTIPVKGNTVHAVAGIGNPQRFFKSLEDIGFKIIPHVFSDHHQFKENELQFDDHYPVLMTEKDAIKCEQFKLDNLWYLSIHANLNNQLLLSVNKLLNI